MLNPNCISKSYFVASVHTVFAVLRG